MIPARMASTRLPGKMLLAQTGRPLIQHVFEQVRRAGGLSRVVIATDDPGIYSAARAVGAESVMTRADHPNGTSRLAEAAAALGLGDDSLIVNVQGDEPEIEPGAIEAAVLCARGSDAPVATLASPFFDGEDPANPNIVKVVRAADGHALYFSRSLIPHARAGGTPVSPLKHVGLYTYRAGFLRSFAMLAPTPLEQCEMLEQLRVLEHGYRIAVAVYPCSTQGIDTPEQYDAFVRRFRVGKAPGGA